METTLLNRIEHLITAILFMGIGLCLGVVFFPTKIIEVPKYIYVDVPGPETVYSCVVEDFEIPESAKTSTKTYMDYRAITMRDSAQYRLIHSDKISIDERGFLVTEDGFIGAALGTHFGPVGTKYIFNLDNGEQLKIIKVEVKSDAHTCGHGILDGSGAAIEFVVDGKTEWMQDKVAPNGLIFGGNFNKYFNGTITSVFEVVE